MTATQLRIKEQPVTPVPVTEQVADLLDYIYSFTGKRYAFRTIASADKFCTLVDQYEAEGNSTQMSVLMAEAELHV